jgi:hypothetical protein
MITHPPELNPGHQKHSLTTTATSEGFGCQDIFSKQKMEGFCYSLLHPAIPEVAWVLVGCTKL